MRLARFSSSGKKSYGVLDEDRVISLPALAKMLEQSLPSSLEKLIASGARGRSLHCLIRKATRATLLKATFPLDQVKVLEPIKMPPKIICLGLNYRDHAKEQGKTPPTEPMIFMKPHTAIIGPGESIIKPSFVKQLDYEAELAIIIGKKAKKISPEDAKTCIFGYTILNDVSARDIQFKDKQWTRAKGFDTFAPTGPCITTTDQVEDPTHLTVRTRVNEELRQNSTTRNMVFNVFEVVHYLSQVMTLEPCDIIATGTPAGVAFAMKPKPKFLQNGDIIEVEIESIGTLRNRVMEEKSP